MTFKCLLRGCAQPRFTQANKVIDHVRCNHHQDYRRTRNDDDLFRMKMVSMPKSLTSYGCRECNVVFHGDIKIAIVHLVSNLYFKFGFFWELWTDFGPLFQVLEHGQNVPERHHLRFSCRMCGNKESFSDPRELERHCQTHYDTAKGYNPGRSPTRSTGSRASSSRSRTRSRSRSPGRRREERDRSSPRYGLQISLAKYSRFSFTARNAGNMPV